MSEPKKLVSVLATSASITSAKEEDMIILKKIPCVHNLVQFEKRGKENTKALINSGRVVNAIIPAYAKQLDLQIC